MRFAIALLAGMMILSVRALGEVATTQPSTVGKVAASATLVQPLAVRQRVPAVALKTVDDQSFDLDKEVSRKLTVLIFYRGGWCPFCNRQMDGLQGIVKDLQDSGYQLLAISPDTPVNLAKSADKHSLTYTLLSDSNRKCAQAFGLAFQVDDGAYGRMLKFGVDLEKATGERDHILPVPAVYILGTDGAICFVHFDPDYRKRMDASEILRQAKQALQTSTPADGK